MTFYPPLIPNLIVGIDPGLTGAIAVLSATHDGKPEINALYDMPTKPSRIKSSPNKKQVDPAQLASLIGAFAKEIKFAVVEDVGVMTGQEGTVSSFNFGYGAGVIAGVLSGLRIPFTLLKPAVWKLSLGLTRDKDSSRQKVQTLFPKHADAFSRRKDDGRAEAVLLALIGLRL